MDRFQTQIRELIAQNELEKVIELLHEVKVLDEVVLIISDWTAINSQRISNIIAFSDFVLEKNKIKKRILDLIRLNELSEDELEKPDESHGLLLHANELFDLKEFAQALHYYKRALLLYPQNEKAIYGYAKCLYDLKSFNAMLAFCEKKLAKTTRKDKLNNLIGNVHLNKGYYNEAKYYYELALNEKPDSRIYFHNVLLALDNGKDFSGQIRLCTEFIEKFPNQAYYYFKRSKIYEKGLNEFNRALEDINIAISLENSNPEFYYSRSLIYSKRKNFQSCMSDINFAYNLAPSNHYLKMAGAILHDNDYVRDALNYYSRALAIDPKDYSLYYNRADCYYKLAYYEKALSDIDFCIDHLGNKQAEFDLRKRICNALNKVQYQ